MKDQFVKLKIYEIALVVDMSDFDFFGYYLDTNKSWALDIIQSN